ncbi:hypothetical protein B0T13DRAFT_224002 [Neurospora crassa]|nr:hypothetical protein B0T13DRAFT_224002 [Neurospora crassa]
MSSSVSTLRRRVGGSGRSRSRTATDSATGSTPTSTSSARCGPYDHAFQAHLFNFDVYLHPQRVRQRLPAPDNLDEIRRALAQGPRRSLSPSRFLRTEFEEFELAHACATNERMVTEHVIPKIHVQRQACYNGALGARGMQHLIPYGASKLVYDNKAYTLTCTYQTGTLKMYTAYVIPPAKPGGWSRYGTTLVTDHSLEGGPDMYRAALTAYRNGLDWAERQRNEAIEHANMKAQAALAGIGTDVGAPASPDYDDGTPGHTPPGSSNAASNPSPKVDNAVSSASPPKMAMTQSRFLPRTTTQKPRALLPPGGGDNGTCSSATNEAFGLRPRRERARASQQDNTPTTRGPGAPNPG